MYWTAIQGQWLEQTIAERIAQFRINQYDGITIMAEKNQNTALDKEELEKKLQESQERYRIISELTSDFAYSFLVTPGGTLVYEWATEAIIRVTGYTLAEINTLGWKNVFHPEDVPVALQKLELLLSGSSDVREFRIITKSGEVRWVRSYGYPVRDEQQGSVVRIYGAAQDITEHKRADEALLASEDRYKSLVDAVTAYTYFVEVRDGRSISTRHSMGCIPVTGYSPADYEANQNLWYSMIHPEDRGMVEQAVSGLLSGRPAHPLEHRIIRRDGTEAWVRDTMVSHKDAGGRLMRYDGLVENITERKRAEEEKARVIAELKKALAKVKMLAGLLPICASCKKVRDDKGYWQQIELYIRDHSEAEFSHGLCPDCIKKLYPDLYNNKKE